MRDIEQYGHLFGAEFGFDVILFWVAAVFRARLLPLELTRFRGQLTRLRIIGIRSLCTCNTDFSISILTVVIFTDNAPVTLRNVVDRHIGTSMLVQEESVIP